jgi:hypothetical protein
VPAHAHDLGGHGCGHALVAAAIHPQPHGPLSQTSTSTVRTHGSSLASALQPHGHGHIHSLATTATFLL